MPPATPTPSGRIVAIDYGKRRVGMAMSDPLRMFATPVGTFSPDEALVHLHRLLAADGIERILIGWPLQEDGQPATITRQIEPYIRRIEKRLPGVPVQKVDERFTSQAAKARLHEAGASRKMRADRGLIDAEAAAVMLSDFLAEEGG
jgi:putative holliday junction resolvase